MTTFETWIVILTSVYVAGTLLLFGVTAYQIYHYRKELRHRAVLDMAAANREILMIGIQHPVLLKLFTKGRSKEEELLSRYAQLWINHAHAIWHRHTIGHLDDEEWLPVREDMLEMFNVPVVKSRWDTTKWAYPKGFQMFIDDYLQKSLGSRTSSNSG